MSTDISKGKGPGKFEELDMRTPLLGCVPLEKPKRRDLAPLLREDLTRGMRCATEAAYMLESQIKFLNISDIHHDKVTLAPLQLRKTNPEI